MLLSIFAAVGDGRLWQFAMGDFYIAIFLWLSSLCELHCVAELHRRQPLVTFLRTSWGTIVRPHFL